MSTELLERLNRLRGTEASKGRGRTFPVIAALSPGDPARRQNPLELLHDIVISGRTESQEHEQVTPARADDLKLSPFNMHSGTMSFRS